MIMLSLIRVTVICVGLVWFSLHLLAHPQLADQWAKQGQEYLLKHPHPSQWLSEIRHLGSQARDQIKKVTNQWTHFKNFFKKETAPASDELKNKPDPSQPEPSLVAESHSEDDQNKLKRILKSKPL